MKRLYFTAGPSQLYSSVPKYIEEALAADIPSISHRGQQFVDIFNDTRASLKELLNVPEDFEILFFSSATEIWERIIQNCVESVSTHFVNGSFGERFHWTAKMLGKKPTIIEAPFGEGFTISKVKVPDNSELMAFTHNESSSGVMWQVEDIYALGEKYPDKLIAIDVVSSIPYPKIDYEKVDLVYFSVQKGFGLPSGLGVLIASPRAMSKQRDMLNKGILTGTYHSFNVMKNFADKGQTTETPNVLNIYLLGKICREYIDYGIGNIRKETDEKAAMLYDYFEKHDRFSLSVKNKRDRSQTLVVVNTGGESKKIVKFLETLDIEIGYGYADAKETQIRIANFPAHSKEDVERLINGFQQL
jgi:phosphoserine aminotransferase